MRAPIKTLFQTQDARLKKITTQAVGAMGNSFDPILERHLGKPVVIELMNEAGKEEFSGLLREYSQGWLSIFDCQVKLNNWLPLGDDLRLTIQRDLDFAMEISLMDDGQPILSLTMECFASNGLRCKRIEGKEYRFDLDVDMQKGDRKSWQLTDIPAALWSKLDRTVLPLFIQLVAPERQQDDGNNTILDYLPDLYLLVESVASADVIVPRSRAVLRHSAAFVKQG
ncbi:MAG: hypothetical protein V3W04_05690 [Gammaproteobacteria bacterium]